jgi:predicted nucleic acid-binding protein
MKHDLKGRVAVGTSALIELVYCGEAGQKLKDALENDVIEAYTTELAMIELSYILCRKLGWKESNQRVNKLIASGYFRVEDTLRLIDEAAKTKCKRAISLSDCFILALAHKIVGSALFARKERELEDEMRKEPFNVNLVFLEETAAAAP